jgi:hypothetical protein
MATAMFAEMLGNFNIERGSSPEAEVVHCDMLCSFILIKEIEW